MAMLSLSSQKREKQKDLALLRKQGLVPAVLYGPATENTLLTVDAKEFQQVYNASGESTLISLNAEGQEHTVLIHDTQLDPLTNKISHIDFYQPRLDREIEVMVPVVLEGEPPAVKELGGTLMKNVHELEVRALPQNLPHEIRVDVSQLQHFEDHVAVKDLPHSDMYEVLADGEEMIAMIVPPENVDTLLAEPVQENIEAIERAGEQKEEAPAEEEA